MNSILLLQSAGRDQTKATYICEFDYGGWISSLIVDLFADNMVKRTMNSMKKEAEPESYGAQENLSIEEEVKRTIERLKLEQKQRDKDASNSLEKLSMKDVQNRIKILEKQLSDINHSNDAHFDALKKELVVELELAREKSRSR